MPRLLSTFNAIAYGVRGLLAYRRQDLAAALADLVKARDLGHNMFWLDEEYHELYNKREHSTE
jgi:hypothetical protein